MFIVYLRNGNFGLFKSHSMGSPELIAECESYDAAMQIKLEMEE